VPKQLPLQFEFQSNQNFSTFYSGGNEEIIDHLQHFISNDEQLVFIWGGASAGKTHLLQATCQAIPADKHSFYFSFNSKPLPNPEMLDGLESFDLVCFDNIEQIIGDSVWEQAFFYFFNRHRDANKKLLLSASCPPIYLDMQLTDLKTRMAWGLTLKLKQLSDEQQLQALIYKANDLGFDIPLNVGRFLISHYVRDIPSIWSLLNTIEHATLAAKRKLTIPFLKQIMSERDSHETG